MVCREAQVGSAVTSYVIQTTSLEERQVLSLYHEVMRDGRTAPNPSDAQRAVVIDNLRTAVLGTDGRLSPARRRSIINRLDRARTEPMNGQRFYSTERLLERARRAETALNDYYAATARDLGIPEAEVRTSIASLRRAADADTNLRPTRGFVTNAREDANYAGLPLDRQTAYAIETLNARRTQHRATRPSRPAVTRETVNSSSIAEMGYDPTTGRCEVVMRSNPGVPYAYRMTQAEYDAFRNAPSVGSHFATHIRGNNAHRYADADSAAEASTQVQCATCGQFAGPGHACPPRDSVEERNRTERLARRAATSVHRPRAERTTTTTPAPATVTPDPVRIHGTQRRYHGESGTFRTVSLTQVQGDARRNPGGVIIPVQSYLHHVAGPDGPHATHGGGAVFGAATVTYNGRGRGYTATAVTAPGDTGTDHLRCTCADYRATYDCVHVRQTIQDLNTRLNQDSIRERHAIGPAIETLTAELAQDRAESIAAQETSQATWGASPVTYATDPAAFQADYKAAKDRINAGENPVAYMTENATDGLGARGTGRGFGVELEFDIDPNVDRATAIRNIGTALHAAGLTRNANQTHYHAASSRGYTEEHRGGWSFEQDCTVAGEIVSPIMYDTPETWENLQKVCDIIRDNGGVVTTRTGSHVHVSAHNYDHTVANHNRLLGAFAENEDVIYRLSSNPERGSHRGARWCAPNRVPSAGYTSIHNARNSNNSHGLGLNMQSVGGSTSDHVEFRTYDASLNPSVIQTQIKMSLGLTESAFRDGDYQPGSHTPLGTHRSHNRQTHGASRRLTGQAWEQDTAGYRAFADRLFRRPEDKAQMTALFAWTKWQRGGNR